MQSRHWAQRIDYSKNNVTLVNHNLNTYFRIPYANTYAAHITLVNQAIGRGLATSFSLPLIDRSFHGGPWYQFADLVSSAGNVSVCWLNGSSDRLTRFSVPKCGVALGM